MAENPINTLQLLRDLPSQFAPLRSLLEANLSPYIKIIAEEVDCGSAQQ